jgi:hypothetical protein
MNPFMYRGAGHLFLPSFLVRPMQRLPQSLRSLQGWEALHLPPLHVRYQIIRSSLHPFDRQSFTA